MAIVPSLTAEPAARPRSWNPIGPIAEFARRLAVAIAWSFYRHRWMAAFVLAYFAVAILVERHLTGQVGAAFNLYTGISLQMVPMMLLALLIGYPVYVMVALRPQHLTRTLVHRFRNEVFTVERLAAGLPVLVLLPIFLNSFTIVKSAIPAFHPFAWDSALEAADRWLHGGVAPWEILQPLLGNPLASQVLSFCYVLWFFVTWFMLVWQTFDTRDRRLRAQFFGTLLLAWVLLGSIAAIVFSSAGPCFFGRVTGLPDPYAPLMAYLHETNEHVTIWALTAQERLWTDYSAAGVSLGGGISAMPSMHLSMAFLFVLLGWRVHRLIGLAALLYCIAIQIGSVQLGWHYALDGYVSIAATAVIWWVMGRILDRREAGLRAADRRPGPPD